MKGITAAQEIKFMFFKRSEKEKEKRKKKKEKKPFSN